MVIIQQAWEEESSEEASNEDPHQGKRVSRASEDSKWPPSKEQCTRSSKRNWRSRKARRSLAKCGFGKANKERVCGGDLSIAVQPPQVIEKECVCEPWSCIRCTLSILSCWGLCIHIHTFYQSRLLMCSVCFWFRVYVVSGDSNRCCLIEVSCQ